MYDDVMQRLHDPELLQQKLNELGHSMAWLGRQVGRSRQRVREVITNPATTLVPDRIADAIERATFLQGRLFHRDGD